MNFLALIPLRAWLELGALAVILGAGFWWTAHERHLGYEKGKAEIQAQWAKQIALESKVAAEETARNEAKEQKTILDQGENLHEADRFNAQASAARARADAVDVGLQQRIDSAAASCPMPGDPAAATTSPTASAAADLSADMQRRLGEATKRLDAAARQLADFADSAHEAGQLAERDYDALDGLK